MGKNLVILVAALFFAPAQSSTSIDAGDRATLKVIPRLMTTPRALVFFTIPKSGFPTDEKWSVEVRSGKDWQYLGRTAGTMLLRDDTGTGRGPNQTATWRSTWEELLVRPGDVVPTLFDTRGLKQGKTYRFSNRSNVEFVATFPVARFPVELGYGGPPLACQKKTDVLPPDTVSVARIDQDAPTVWKQVGEQRCSKLPSGTYQIRSSGGSYRYFTTNLLR